MDVTLGPEPDKADVVVHDAACRVEGQLGRPIRLARRVPAVAIVAVVGAALVAPTFGPAVRGPMACVDAGVQGTYGLTLVSIASLVTRRAFLQMGASVLLCGTSLLSHGNS